LVDDAAMKLGEAWKKAGNMDEAIAAFENLQRRYPSSEFVPEAQKQIRLIKAFDIRSKDASMQKLALLVGDVIAQKSKGNLAYRLAEIYFFDIKDYQLAADQFAYALTVDLEETLRPIAWFKQAQSFELLHRKKERRLQRKKNFFQRRLFSTILLQCCIWWRAYRSSGCCSIHAPPAVDGEA